MSDAVLMIVTNFFLCALGGGIAVCRLGRMNRFATKGEVRSIYNAYLIFYAVSALSPMWGNIPTVTQILMGVIVIGVLLISFSAWRNGPPLHTFKNAMNWAHDEAASITGKFHRGPNVDA